MRGELELQLSCGQAACSAPKGTQDQGEHFSDSVTGKQVWLGGGFVQTRQPILPDLAVRERNVRVFA